MKRYEICIDIDDPDYIDSLVISLARQGYDVYYNRDLEKVCFSIYEEDMTEIKV